MNVINYFNAKVKALLVKLFSINKEYPTTALYKFQVQKDVNTGKGSKPILGLVKLVLWFEETATVEDRAICA